MNPLGNNSPVNNNQLTPQNKEGTITLVSALMNSINSSMTNTLVRSLKDSTIEERDATLNQLKIILLESAKKVDELISKDKQLLQGPVVAPQANPIPLAAQQPSPPKPVQQAGPIFPSNPKAREESKKALENIQASLFLPLTSSNASSLLFKFVKKHLGMPESDFNKLFSYFLQNGTWDSTITLTIHSKVFTATQTGTSIKEAKGKAIIAIIKKLRMDRDFYKDFLLPMQNLPILGNATAELIVFLQEYSKDWSDNEFKAQFKTFKDLNGLLIKLGSELILNKRVITLREATIDTGVPEKGISDSEFMNDCKRKARNQAAYEFSNLLYEAPKVLTFEDHLELLRKYPPKGEDPIVSLEGDLPAQAAGPQVEKLPQTAPEDSDDGMRSVMAVNFGSKIKEFRKVSRIELVGTDGKAEKNFIRIGDDKVTVYRYLTSSVRKFHRDYPLLSVGSSSEREIISLDSKGNEHLDRHFSTLNAHLKNMAKDKPLSTREVLNEVNYYVRTVIFNGGTDIQEVISKAKKEGCQTVRFEDESDHTKADIPIIPIDAFVKAGKGVCRQHSLTTSYILYRLTQEAEPLISGTVKHIRDVVQGGVHAWTAFIPQSLGPKEPLEKWSIDTLWNTIDNFAKPSGIAFLKATYDPKSPVNGAPYSAIENMIRKTSRAAKENKQEAILKAGSD